MYADKSSLKLKRRKDHRAKSIVAELDMEVHLEWNGWNLQWGIGGHTSHQVSLLCDETGRDQRPETGGERKSKKSIKYDDIP